MTTFIYFYQGKLYTTSSGVYNNNMFIEGHFYTKVPLKPNADYDKTTFLSDSKFSFSFSDGFNTYSNIDPQTLITEHEGFEFTITTGDDAMPKFWFISLKRNASADGDTFSDMSTGKDARPISFDNATAGRMTGQYTEQIGEGEVHSEGIWTMNSVP